MSAFRTSYRPVFTLSMLILIVCAAQKPGLSSEPSYLSFQVPGALGTYPMSINNSMTGVDPSVETARNSDSCGWLLRAL
jgi:hypothetical protein